MILAGAAVLVLPQAELSERLVSLRQEALAVAAHVEQVRLATGRYPTNLAGYSFRKAGLERHLTYVPDPERGGFRVSYWIATPNVSYDYSPHSGWVYYPD
jgi:hypothetical protein